MSQESITRRELHREYLGDITSNEILLLVGILLSQESIARRNYIGSTWVISQVMKYHF